MPDRRAVCYSVTGSAGSDRLLGQLSTSLATLRRHNRRVRVVVFGYGPVTADLVRVCLEHDATLQEQGDYRGRLAEHCPEGAGVLAHYPVLHKFLNHGWLARAPFEQVLCCDCDTVFRDDVELLFDRYGGPDLVAREEVHTARSRHGSNTSFLDEPALRGVASSLGVRVIPPFNTGAVLLNNRIWEQFALLDGWYVRCAWHFVLWLSLHPAHADGTGFGTIDGFGGAHRSAAPGQLDRALPYPSRNQWILDEIAMWLTLGALPLVRTADFAPTDVAQNGEFVATGPELARWALCHYYSGNTDNIADWLAGALARS